MRLIDGDRIVTAQLYDDQYEEFKEEKMSIIDYVNMYTTEGVTTADDVLDKIRVEIEETIESYVCDKEENTMKAQGMLNAMQMTFDIIGKYIKE